VASKCPECGEWNCKIYVSCAHDEDKAVASSTKQVLYQDFYAQGYDQAIDDVLDILTDSFTLSAVVPKIMELKK